MKDQTAQTSTLLRSAVLAFCLLDIMAGSAHAYLDPGTGSQALQIGIAGFLGLAFTLRGMFSRLFLSLRGKR